MFTHQVNAIDTLVHCTNLLRLHICNNWHIRRQIMGSKINISQRRRSSYNFKCEFDIITSLEILGISSWQELESNPGMHVWWFRIFDLATYIIRLHTTRFELISIFHVHSFEQKTLLRLLTHLIKNYWTMRYEKRYWNLSLKRSQ